jgi:hypothetical protein
MPAMRFPQIQELPFGRYSDFMPPRALGAADKGRRGGIARNPLPRFRNLSASFFMPIALQYKHTHRGRNIPVN